MSRTWVFLYALAATACSAPIERPPDVPEHYELLYAQDFDGDPAARLEDFTFSDPSAWRIDGSNGTSWLELFGKSAYRPPHRSPLNIALIAGRHFGDFVLEARLQQTGREYGHRDMCVFFGFQGPDRFYYLHLASKADDHAHNLFRVDSAPRVKFADATTRGVDWGDGAWHDLRIVRDRASGRIDIYFDDMSAPIMRGHDTGFDWGQIGFGSFDDTGRITDIRIWGPEMRATTGTSFR